MKLQRIVPMMILVFVFSLFGVLAEACDLPVCDIPGTIAKLESGTAGERFQFIGNLRTKYRRSEVPAELENLRAFALEARDLSTRLNDEDWLIRESVMLIDQAVIGLIKFRKPPVAKHMIASFKELSTEGSRFEAIKHWTEKVSQIEVTSELREIITFAEEAKNHSTAMQDADWIPREAERLMTLASTQLAILDPYHEGIFQITLSCPSINNSSCKQNYPDLATMTILEAGQRSGYGLVTSFIMPSPVEPAYLFGDSQFNGGNGRMYGFSKVSTPTFPRPAEFKLQLDRDSGAIRGVLIDSRSNGFVRFEGKPIRRVKELIDQTSGSTVTVTQGDLVGTYETKIGHRTGRLVIKETGDLNLIASFLPQPQGDPLDFKTGTFVKSQGVLSLVAFGTKMDFLKAILRFEKRNGQVVATGFHFNSFDGSTEDWVLQRTGSITVP